MKINGTIEAIYSKRDINGNCYWAMRYTDHNTGKVVFGMVSGGESNITGIRFGWGRPGEWDKTIDTRVTCLGIREFDRVTKYWPYAGCTPEDLRAYIRAKLAEESCGEKMDREDAAKS